MPTNTVIDVAKKNAKAEAKPDPDRKPMVVQIRGTLGYKEWAERLAAADGSTLAALYDRAVRQYAKAIGFTENPPQR